MRSNSSRRSGPSASVAIPPSRTRVHEALEVGERRGSCSRLPPSKVMRAEQLAARTRRGARAATARRRTAARAWSRAARPSAGAGRARRPARRRRGRGSGATNSSRAGAVGVEHRELVLAEHAAGEEAGDRARLGGQQRAEAGADDAAQRPEPVAEAVGDRVQHALAARRGWPRPTRRGRRPRRRAAARPARGRCRRRRGARSPRRGPRGPRTARDRRRAGGARPRGRPGRRGSSRSPIPWWQGS